MTINPSFVYHLNIHIQKGPHEGISYVHKLSNTDEILRIGRQKKSTLRLQLDFEISSQHLVIYRKINQNPLFLRDLQSTNGTKINDISVVPNQEYNLMDLDIITIGKTIFQIHYKIEKVEVMIQKENQIQNNEIKGAIQKDIKEMEVIDVKETSNTDIIETSIQQTANLKKPKVSRKRKRVKAESKNLVSKDIQLMESNMHTQDERKGMEELQLQAKVDAIDAEILKLQRSRKALLKKMEISHKKYIKARKTTIRCPSVLNTSFQLNAALELCFPPQRNAGHNCTVVSKSCINSRLWKLASQAQEDECCYRMEILQTFEQYNEKSNNHISTQALSLETIAEPQEEDVEDTCTDVQVHKKSESVIVPDERWLVEVEH